MPGATTRAKRTIVGNYQEGEAEARIRYGVPGIPNPGIHVRCRRDSDRSIGPSMHGVREFAGHSDIRTTELYFVRKEEDAEVAARRIQIRVTRTAPSPIQTTPEAE